MMVFALGMGATFVSVTIAATSGVSKQESGLSSGLLTTAQQIGGAIGLAILTGLVTSSTTRYIANLHTTVTPQITAAASVHGFQKGFLFASSFGIIASLIALFVIKPTPVKQPTADHM